PAQVVAHLRLEGGIREVNGNCADQLLSTSSARANTSNFRVCPFRALHTKGGWCWPRGRYWPRGATPLGTPRSPRWYRPLASRAPEGLRPSRGRAITVRAAARP